MQDTAFKDCDIKGRRSCVQWWIRPWTARTLRYVFVPCLVVCIKCGVVIRPVEVPWSSRLWTQPLIHHREARLVYCDWCVVIYLCVLQDGDSGANSPTKRVCVVRKKLEVPKDNLDWSEVCIMILCCIIYIGVLQDMDVTDDVFSEVSDLVLLFMLLCCDFLGQEPF